MVIRCKPRCGMPNDIECRKDVLISSATYIIFNTNARVQIIFSGRCKRSYSAKKIKHK